MAISVWYDIQETELEGTNGNLCVLCHVSVGADLSAQLDLNKLFSLETRPNLDCCQEKREIREEEARGVEWRE